MEKKGEKVGGSRMREGSLPDYAHSLRDEEERANETVNLHYVVHCENLARDARARGRGWGDNRRSAPFFNYSSPIEKSRSDPRILICGGRREQSFRNVTVLRQGAQILPFRAFRECDEHHGRRERQLKNRTST